MSVTDLIFLAENVPNPEPAPPPGTRALFGDWISWGKYVAMFAGVIGLIACSVMMSLGRRNRHHMAADGAAGIPWVVAGLSLASLAVGIVTTVM